MSISNTNLRYDQKFKKSYDFLNAEQKEVVDKIEGALMVVAGPGAGKTQVMSLRAANILRQTDVMPDSILCLTFTDSATQNLQKRLHRFIGNAAYDVSVFTFHGFASQLQNEFAEFFYEDRDWTVVDELEQVLMLERIIESLPLEANLRKQIPSEGYVYMGDVRGKLSQLKRAGFSAAQYSKLLEDSALDIEKMNKLVGSFLDELGRLSKGKIDDLVLFVGELEGKFEFEESKSRKLNETERWAKVFLKSMAAAILESKNEESTKPFSAWKKENISKDKDKNSVLKDWLRLEKNMELAYVYQEYEKKMDEAGFVDFDDLLMDVREKLMTDEVFRAVVQERYLYVMVDEFQDTSGVQMDIVSLVLGDADKGTPNVMVVGDDDQSIYKFQGARVSNILKFKEVYPECELVVLDKNYRSTQNVLDLIRDLVVQGEDRLENHIDEISKELVAGNSGLEKGRIEYREFNYELQEMEWIAEKVGQMYRDGEDLSEVAVIARGHRSLRELSKLLHDKGVPFSYEHSKDILESEIVEKIYKILLYIDAEFDREKFGRDDLVVEILSYEFWGISRLELWKYVHKAYKERKDLIELIDETETVSERIREVIEFLVVLGQKANEISVFEILQYLIGGKELVLEDEREFVSPMKEYYFPKTDEASKDENYLSFLMDLKTLFDRLKDYRVGEVLRVHEVVEYISSHMDHKLRINNNFNLVSGKNALNLMTAHKSKGMEFETVFVMSCNAKAWESKGRPDRLKTLLNVNVQTNPDDTDDFLRLFYVALSRAKRNLYMGSYLLTSNGKEVKPFRFMSTVLENYEENGVGVFDEVVRAEESVDGMDERSVEIDLGMLLGLGELENVDVVSNSGEKDFMKSLVKDYKLSVTAFNNFLDLSNGGPKYFLEKNLLRFPQAKSVYAEYGTAMHEGISKYIIASKKAGELVDISVLMDEFVSKLRRSRLTDKEFKEFSAKGKKYLERVYRDIFVSGKFGLQDISELSFSSENVLVGEEFLDEISFGKDEEYEVEQAHLNGAMDWVSFDLSEDGKKVESMKVVDFKTGSALESWDKNYQEYQKTKAWKYRNQLAFYYLLMKGHRKLSRVPIAECGLYFLEADEGSEYLGLQVGEEELAKMERLVTIVYNRIINLDFPDVSMYTPDFMGTCQFVDDLLDVTMNKMDKVEAKYPVEHSNSSGDYLRIKQEHRKG
jgi:DNA helicase-2/ATP-dependent DNA helicase PcrA